MIQTLKFKTSPNRIRGFGFSEFELIWLRFVWVRGASFVLRISDFDRRLLGAINFFEKEKKECLYR